MKNYGKVHDSNIYLIISINYLKKAHVVTSDCYYKYEKSGINLKLWAFDNEILTIKKNFPNLGKTGITYIAP